MGGCEVYIERPCQPTPEGYSVIWEYSWKQCEALPVGKTSNGLRYLRGGCLGSCLPSDTGSNKVKNVFFSDTLLTPTSHTKLNSEQPAFSNLLKTYCGLGRA